MSSMQTGTQMVKLRGGSKGLVRYFYLDQHKSCIRWRPSRKNEKAKISIDSIREVCEGKQSEIFQRYSEGSFDPNCCFSLYYGERLESLDLVSSTGEEARTWITGLKYLVAGISDEDSLAKRQRTRDQYPYRGNGHQTFAEADKNGDGSLSISEVLQLLHKLNVNLPRQKVKQMFKEADTDDNQGTLDFEEFCSFYKMMSTRRDLYLLMLTYSNHKDHLDSIDLTRFLEVEQKMTKVTKDHCLEIVNKFEPCSENQKQGVLGIDGFTSYMRSPAGDIFNPEHYEVTQDMSQPLCNYFIASSHNTYLMGDQLMSQSRVDMYAWVLQAGCRCVEVDCWDGQDGEPIVHHGYTLTSKILFKDVIETINKYAFLKNDYPVILSIENHCSVPQQKKMAQYLVEVMGDKLDLSAVKADEQGHLPSPDTLKGKILVKGKKLPPNIDEDNEEGDVTDEDSADEMEDDCKLMNGDTSMTRKQVENVAKKKLDNLLKESKIRDREDPDSFTIATLSPTGKPTDQSASKVTTTALTVPLTHWMFSCRKKKTMKLSRALSDLVKYTKSVGVSDIETQGDWQVSSLSETKAHQIMQQKAAAFIHFNQRQLSRIYPSSYRVDSSNFNPQPFWNSGCHLVALNYQSEGRVLQLNRAKFNSNGNCGYILKPACMCEGVFNPMMEDPLPGQMKKQLVLKIISGQQLPKPKDSMLGDRGEIIDPFVEVEIIGLPVDCCKEQTRVVDDNGFNPMWEETLVFTLHMPELVLVRFLVWDHDPIGQDFIGQRTIAFNSMIPGFRHVYLEGMEEASIFVHVSVHDITGKGKVASGIKGLFHRNPKQASLDSHVAAQLSRKHPFGAHLLRRTASEPTKGEPKVKKGFPEIAIDTKDYSSEGASEDRESEDRDLSASPQPPQLHQRNGDTTDAAAPATPRQGTNGHHSTNGNNAVHKMWKKSRGLNTFRMHCMLSCLSALLCTVLPLISSFPPVVLNLCFPSCTLSLFLRTLECLHARSPTIFFSLTVPCLITQRRHTWSRLYMEGLKQSSSPAKKPSAAAVLAAAAASPLDTAASMSKSLGDLTSDDIACNFDSKYRSISRSFIVRPSRNDPRRGLQRPRPPSDLTEQLRRLTDVEPLTARDFATQAQQESPEEAQEEPPLRRMSSRSQSRVRYIANRAKEAQERKRLQGLNQPHLAAGVASISIFGGGSPIEERGNPEGACCVAQSPCTSLDLLSQLSPPGLPPNRQSQTQSQTSPNSDNNEVFFMLKL
uniref:Phosphoinositide phospholipase C n=1 Tax=Oncorhynchus kisutch TaxID=8019 RepID=A0A8C7JMK8_ONCKI